MGRSTMARVMGQSITSEMSFDEAVKSLAGAETSFRRDCKLVRMRL